jgi:hypothetical protein
MQGVMLAARAVVQELGGVDQVARALGKNRFSLSHELNPRAEGHKLGLETAVQIDQLHGQGRIASAFAAACGGAFVPDASAEEPAELDTVAHTARIAREFADVLREVSETTREGSVSDNDLMRVRRETLELIGALNGMLVHLGALNHAGKPAQLRGVA